ncbi:MAG: Holliday junction branch migration protein RuvA, partial [Paraglaciecola sp.]|nr:Holliday junction branch migration protein RuvA [Paraglaciecola sp.]
KQERAVFRELIKASGVGPKLALTILSGMNAAQFMQAVSLDDVTGLTKLPGVGKKTAERLVIELRDRLTKLSVAPSNTEAFGRLSSLPIENTFLQSNDAKEEALSALVALGYKPAQGSKVINSVYKSEMSSEALIREALRAMI